MLVSDALWILDFSITWVWGNITDQKYRSRFLYTKGCRNATIGLFDGVAFITAIDTNTFQRVYIRQINFIPAA